MKTLLVWVCALFFLCPFAGASEDVACAVADNEALPRLTVKDWYFEIDEKPAYLVCGDYDAAGGPNDVVCLHSAGSGKATQYFKWTVDLSRVKPVVFNELFAWWHNPREVQRAVFWNSFISGSMVCAYQWGEGKTTSQFTEADLSALAKFASSIPFHRFSPNNGWIRKAPGQSCAAVSWIDPATGELIGQRQNLHASGTVDLVPDPYELDLACYIEKTETK